MYYMEISLTGTYRCTGRQCHVESRPERMEIFLQQIDSSVLFMDVLAQNTIQKSISIVFCVSAIRHDSQVP